MKKLLLLISLLLATVANAEIFQPEDYVKLQFQGCFPEHQFTESSFKNDISDSLNNKLKTWEKEEIKRTGYKINSQLQSIRSIFNKGSYEKVLSKAEKALKLIKSNELRRKKSDGQYEYGLSVETVAGNSASMLHFYSAASVEIPYLAFISAEELNLDQDIQEKWLQESFSQSRTAFSVNQCSKMLARYVGVKTQNRRAYSSICSKINPYEAFTAGELGILEHRKENYLAALSLFSIALTNYNLTAYKDEASDSILFERMNILARTGFAAEKAKKWCIAYEGFRRSTEIAKVLDIKPLEVWGKKLIQARSELDSIPKDNWSSEYGLYQPGGAYMPLFKPVPVYPKQMARSGREGCVMLEFNVNEQGKTEDIEVVWSTNKSFNQNAKKTVERFLYQPQIEEGKPVKVEGVLNQITFIIEGKSKPRNYIPEGCP